ncbi:4Fe-4S dicluster domain-containing protein, partial [bacterium]|nr:4Fe-4S dicluster domain-containing protein [bacterium]
MRLPSLFQPRILKEAFKALFTGPYTTKFPFQPHVPAEKFRGKPEYDEKECVGCGACAEVCPSNAIEVIDEEKRRLVLHYDTCIFCGQCQANCITEKGITLTKEYDLTLFDRSKAIEEVEKELLRCEFCNSVIGAVDHIKWLAKKLGPLA